MPGHIVKVVVVNRNDALSQNDAASLTQIKTLQQSVARLRQFLNYIELFVETARESDPLPSLHDLASDLLPSDAIQIRVPANADDLPQNEPLFLSRAITAGGRVVGRIDARRADEFASDDRILASAIAQMIGAVLEQSSLYSQFEQYRSQAQANTDTIERLLTFNREISGDLQEPQQLALALATRVPAMVGGERASLLLTPFGQAKEPVLALSIGELLPTERALAVSDQGLAGLVLRERRPLIIDETDTDRRWLSLSEREHDTPTRCAMAAPVVWGERVLGALTVTTTETHLFDTPQLNLLELIAHHVALALYSANVTTCINTIAMLFAEEEFCLTDALQVARMGLDLIMPTQADTTEVTVAVADLVKITAALDRADEARKQLRAAYDNLTACVKG